MYSRSQWPRGLRRRSKAARLLRSSVRIQPEAWIFVCCECCVLSGRGLCDELITRPEESYRLCCVVVCDLDTSRMGAPYIYDISHLRVNVPIVLKSGSLNLLEPSGPVQACNGIALPFTMLHLVGHIKRIKPFISGFRMIKAA